MPELVENFDGKSMAVGDLEGFKYDLEICGRQFVNSEECLKEIEGCSWKGPFVHKDYKPGDRLEHYYLFSMNENGDNSYYVALEMDLRDFNGKRRQIATF